MTDIETLQPKMIERYLRGHELMFDVNQDGRFILHYDDDELPDYQVAIGIDGPSREILTVLVVNTTTYPASMRAAAEAFVSGWNRLKWWPKAFTDGDRGRGFSIVGEICFTLAAGVHWALFEEILDSSLAAGQLLISESAAALEGLDEFDPWPPLAG